MGKDCDRLDGHGGVRGEGGGAISTSESKRKKANAANGCMSAFYHLFHFQHCYFPCHHHLTIDSSSRSKGLKLIEEAPTSTIYKEKQLLNIPENIIQVRTETGTTSSRLRALVTSSSEICNSPSCKTPNLVARLMGLDLLPDKTDTDHSLPNLHSMNHNRSNRLTNHILSKKGTRSLPESPRISSSRKSDFDIHRLSLHLNRENHKHQEFGCSSRLKEMEKETRSPRDYARQVVKQIKERVVTRRVVGIDITNSVKNREAGPSQNSNEFRRDTIVSCSPRRIFSDKENKLKTDSLPSFRQEQIIQKPKKMILVSVSKEKQSQKRVNQRELRPINQRNKAESETRRPIKPSRIKQREAFLSETTEAEAKRCSNTLHKKKFEKLPKPSSATRPPQKQINERDRLRSKEDASICFSPLHKLDEILTETVKRSRNYHESGLIGELCSAVERYTSKRFPAPEETTSIEDDHILEKKKELEEEGEEIVAEIERDIIDALVRETASDLSF